MMSSTPALTNRRWLLCILASFLGFLLLSLYLNQRRPWPAGTVLASLRSLDSPLPSHSQSINMELSPQYNLLHLAPQPSTAAAVLHQSSGPNAELAPVQPSSAPTEIGSSPEPSPVAVVVEKISPAVQSKVSSQTNIELPVQSRENASWPLDGVNEKKEKGKEEKCNIFDGRWVYDPKAYPLYRAHLCPFLTDQVSCQRNGRPDSDYEHWRWEANGYDLPRFDGRRMLERLRGKRVVIVGDSLNRNQWMSLACLLYSSVHRKSRVLFKSRGADMSIRAMDYDCSVEFYWSPFLVRLDQTKGKATVIKLEKLPDSARLWRGADVMVFNTGHWWTHRGRMRSWKYFERGGELVEEMEGDTAFAMALETWARWIDRNVDPTRTSVFFRSISPEHKRENWCYNQKHPITNETYVQWFPRSMISVVERTIQEMKTPVKYLNITGLSAYRREGHTSVYTSRKGKLLTNEQRKQPQAYADCSHWCLPGVPDTWNVLLYASIIEAPSVL